MKNKNNSAILKFGTGLNLLFTLNSDQLFDENGEARYNLSLMINDSMTRPESYLISVEENEITFLMNYNTTIECAKSKLSLDLS